MSIPQNGHRNEGPRTMRTQTRKWRHFPKSTTPRRAVGGAGFSMIELLVAITLTAILVAVIYALFTSYERAVMTEEGRIEIAQGSRATLSRLKADMELVGSNVQFEKGQPGMIYAGPWEMLFNGDVTDAQFELTAGSSVTYPFVGGGRTYTGRFFDSPAETVHYYMSTGTSTASSDMDFSSHPNDRVLVRRINGNPNTEVAVGYGLLADIDGSSQYTYPDGARVTPLFSFWGDFDFDPETPPTLWGDSDGNGALSDSEMQALYSGSYSHSYAGPFGTVSISGLTRGALYLNNVAGSPSNTEDANNNGRLDYGEDVNRNGRLDLNLLDSAITRIDLNVTMVAQRPDKQGAAFIHNSPYKEHTVRTSVDPRNLGKPIERDCAGNPDPATDASAGEEDCGRGVFVSWNKSSDDGDNDNDVLWYEIYRSINGGTAAFLTVVAADGGANAATCGGKDYCFVDQNIEAGDAYVYSIYAVDCGDNHSSVVTTGSVTPTEEPVLAPTEFEIWDSGCYKSAQDYGSITLRWHQSAGTGVTEYWIYRSNGNVIDEMISVPIAKVSTSHAQLNTACAAGATSYIQAEYQCRNAKFYKYNDYYVWRDELDSPGRNASLPPIDGAQFGIKTGGYNPSFSQNDMMRYQYEVRAYNSSTECLSNPLEYVSECAYNEAQSINSEVSSDTPSRFSPPWNIQVRDTSLYDGSDVEPALTVSWDASPSQFCEISGADGDIPDLTRYYVYRSTTYLDYEVGTCRLRHALLKEDGSGVLDGGFQFYSGTGIPANAIVFKGVAMTSATTLNYSFKDQQSVLQTAGNAWYLNIGTEDLKPDTGSSVDSVNHTLKLIDPTVGYCNPSESAYEYMVAAVATNEGGNGVPHPTDWSFGAACSENGYFDCDCPAVILPPSGTEYCNLHGPITVNWVWDQAPPNTSTIRLLAKDALNPNADYFVVDTTVTCTGSNCSGDHQYADQIPGVTYDYAAEVTCPLPEDCTRIVDLNVTEDAGSPYDSHVCFNNVPPAGSPACPSAVANCDTGLTSIELREWLQNCSSTVQTSEAEVWWKVERYSTDDPNGAFPTDPENGDWNGSRYTGYWLRVGQGGAAIWSPSGYDYSAYGLVNLRGLQNTQYAGSAMRSYMFSEYLNPTRKYKYVFTIMVEHPPGGTHPKPSCQQPFGPGTYGSGGDQCAGGLYPTNDPFVVIVDYISKDQCYPPTVSPQASNDGPALKTAGYPWETDTFNWVGNWEILEEGSSYGKSRPWMGREFVFLHWEIHIHIPLSWLGLPDINIDIVFHIGSHVFEYTAGTYIRTDFDGLFGSVFQWLAQWIFEIGFDLCDWCLEVLHVTIFCVTDFWSSCHSDLLHLKLLNMMWSNFNTGVCAATAPGDNQEIEGDIMMQMHMRTDSQDMRLNPTFRGKFRPSENGFNMLQTELDFRDSNVLRTRVQYTYESSVKEFTTASHTITNAEDDDWWSVFYLICTNHMPTSAYYNETFVAMWAKPDNAQTWDWYNRWWVNAPRFTWSTYGRTTAGLGAIDMAGTIPPGCSGFCSNTGGGTYRCNSGAPLRCVVYQQGKVGYWADPFIDFGDQDSYYDNIRINAYCGKCPPDNIGTWLASAFTPEAPEDVRVTTIGDL